MKSGELHVKVGGEFHCLTSTPMNTNNNISTKQPANATETPPAAGSKALTIYYLATAAVCGAIVMMIEVLGSRVVGPFFGVSLFVWTSLITVTLLALALGYGVGGHLSDRFNSAKYLYAIIFVSALFCLLIPFIKVPVLKACMHLGLRGGAFVAASILFGPTLFLLGCVSPYLVKLSARQWHSVGKTVGGLYAVSTLGSTLGSVVTGFWVVGYLGIDKSLYIVALGLGAVAIGYFVFFQRSWKPVLVLLVASVAYPQTHSYSKKLDDGTVLNMLDHVENFYGSIKILESESRAKHARYLLLDNMIQGGVDLQNGLSVFPYTYHMQFLSVANNPNGARCLGIGMGVGIVLKWLEQQGKVCDVVDINPKIFEMSQRYFDYVPKGQRYVQDGRYFLEHDASRYDYVVLDAFSGEQTPAHLLSKEAMLAINRKLNPGAVLSINIISRLEDVNGATRAVAKTLKSVFDNVEVYPVFDIDNSDLNSKIGNIIILAYQGNVRPLNFSVIGDFTVHPYYKSRIADLLGKMYQLKDLSSAVVLSDDYNPVDYFDADAREQIRWEVLKGIDLDFLLL